jgi:hypothetical protein
MNAEMAIQACEMGMDAAVAEGDPCLTATKAFWVCQANLPCNILGDGPNQDCMDDVDLFNACS